jgi:hypothetical protein
VADISQGVPNHYIMKKIILTLALALAAFSASAQYSTTEADGFRFVATKHKVIRTGMTDRHPFEVSITAAQNPENGEWSYSLLIGVMELISHAIPEGGVLLIKTTDDSIIELANQFDDLKSRDYEGRVVPGTVTRTFVNHGSYPITMEQLEALATGVVKIRLQHSGEVVESIYKKDKWGNPMSEMIMELGGLVNREDIREGF